MADKSRKAPAKGVDSFVPSSSLRSAGSFVALQSRGVIAIPADMRKRHHLDEPGAQVELVDRGDGVIEMRPHLARPADQQWFWTERWQEMEHEASQDIAAGRVEEHASAEDFLEHLDALETKT